MFSADSKGIVIIWNSYINPQVDTKRKRKGTGGKIDTFEIRLSSLVEYQDSEQSFILSSLHYCCSSCSLFIFLTLLWIHVVSLVEYRSLKSNH